MQYDLVLSDDLSMPVGRDWLVITHDDGVVLVMRRSAMTSAQVIHEAWAALRSLNAPLTPRLFLVS